MRILSLFAPLFLFPLPATAASLYLSGHGDIGIAYEDEGDGPEFFFHYHLGAGSNLGEGEFEPADIITVAPVGTLTTMPSVVPLNDGTGVSAGDDIWILPQTQQADVPFLGFATEELDSSWSSMTFTLGEVTSPSGAGHFSVWSVGAFSTFDFQFSTNDPAGTVNGDNTLLLPIGAHAHYNLGFSEPGDWEVDITVSGTHDTDGFMSSTRTFNFQVVPEPATALLGLVGGMGLFRRRRYAAD